MHDSVVTRDQGLRYELVYREHGARVWRSVFLYSGDRELTSDAVAEALAQAFRIAAGELKARRRIDHGVVEVAYDMPQPASEVVAALHLLSPKQRAAVVLHFCDGYTLAEVAEIIGSTTSAVSVHLNRARKRLQALLGDNDD